MQIVSKYSPTLLPRQGRVWVRLSAIDFPHDLVFLGTPTFWYRKRTGSGLPVPDPRRYAAT